MGKKEWVMKDEVKGVMEEEEGEVWYGRKKGMRVYEDGSEEWDWLLRV